MTSSKLKYGVTGGAAILVGGIIASQFVHPIAVSAGVIAFAAIVVAHIITHGQNDRASMKAGLQEKK